MSWALLMPRHAPSAAIPRRFHHARSILARPSGRCRPSILDPGQARPGPLEAMGHVAEQRRVLVLLAPNDVAMLLRGEIIFPHFSLKIGKRMTHWKTGEVLKEYDHEKASASTTPPRPGASAAKTRICGGIGKGSTPKADDMIGAPKTRPTNTKSPTGRSTMPTSRLSTPFSRGCATPATNPKRRRPLCPRPRRPPPACGMIDRRDGERRS